MKFLKSMTLIMAASTMFAVSKPVLEPFASGLNRPVWAGMPAGNATKLWIMEQQGKVWVFDLQSGQRETQPFLDLESKVTRDGNEQGMLGLAFAPDFNKSGRYYVNYNDKKGDTCIVRFTSKDRLTTDPASEELLMKIKQPYQNHNGGWVGFGPDGMLYIANGDGGAGNDPESRAQNLGSHLGKILRIDVSSETGYGTPKDNPFVSREGAKAEIWAYGVRNPWRCSFDRKTGDFWMGDVGQNNWEEIDFMPRGKGAGANYGWRLREGMISTPAKGVGGDRPSGSIDPVYVYPHGSGPKEGISVTGGYLYRGAIKELQGRYIFADFQMPKIWSFQLENHQVVDFKNHSEEWKTESSPVTMISSFAEDNNGELFVISLTGKVYRLIDR